MAAQIKRLQSAMYYQEQPVDSVQRLYRIDKVEPHATGLRLPSHMGITADGRVLAGEFAGGTIRDITDPGDYSNPNKRAFIVNMKNPGGIQQMWDGRILAADSGAGKIHDITEGGAASDNNLLFEGVSHPYGVFDFQEEIYTTFSNNSMAGMAKIKKGERYNHEDHGFVLGFPVVVTLEPYRTLAGCGGSWGGRGFGGRLLFSHLALGAIFDVTQGGTFDELRDSRYAWGFDQPLGMTTDPLDGHVYVCERGSGVIKRIHPRGGYSRFAEPLIAGFKDCSCIRFTQNGETAYVCDRAVGTVYRLELRHVEG